MMSPLPVWLQGHFWKCPPNSSFDSQQSTNHEAAKNFDYNQEHLALVGTEAGDWKINNPVRDVKGMNVQESAAKRQDATCSNC